MRYVVFGVGRQGLAAVYDLVKYCEASAVLACDVRFADERFHRDTQQLLHDLLGDRADLIQLQSVDLASLEKSGAASGLAGSDCIVSALPYALNVRASKAAIDAGVPMCDMGGNPEVVERQIALAKEHDHVLVPECGLAPGIANVFMKYLHDHGGATTVQAYCGGLPHPAPDPNCNPLQYKLVFSPAGLISEYMGTCPVLKGGRIVQQQALGGLERFDEAHEAFYTSNNSPRIFEYLASLGIENCQYKTLRYHGHLSKIRALQSLGFLSGAGNTDPELARRLAESEALRFDRTQDRDKVVLSVRGTADGKSWTRIELLDYLDEATRFTAMERTTSWGTTIVAYALAKGLAKPAGFATPEQFIDTAWFLDQIRRRTERVKISESGPVDPSS